MNLSHVTAGLTVRLNQARELLNVIRAAENTARPLTPISSFEASLRGLFYVSCYGALEWSVTTGVHSYLAAIDEEKIPLSQLDWVFNSVALDSYFNAVTDTRARKKWAARRRMFEAFADGTHCKASTASMEALLSNIWPKTIEEIFQCFGIAKPWTDVAANQGYMRELVEKRNSVAHGRQTAIEAGEGTTFTQLDKIHKATSDVALYFLATLEEHANQKLYIQPSFRREYLYAT